MTTKMIKVDKQKICMHPDHKPPTQIVIPPGEVLEHVCDGCGKKSTINSPAIFF